MTFQNFISSQTRSGAGSVRQVIQSRRDRDAFLPARLFGEPAWDMLLELYAAALEQRRVTTTALCERSAVPATTALRWISTLLGEGLIERHPDPLDARRFFVSLSSQGAASMEAYFQR
jgi:DNA-binding MarR family transcriptional regulator